MVDQVTTGILIYQTDHQLRLCINDLLEQVHMIIKLSFSPKFRIVASMIETRNIARVAQGFRLLFVY